MQQTIFNTYYVRRILKDMRNVVLQMLHFSFKIFYEMHTVLKK